MAAVMMGEAEAFYKGERLSGAAALDKAGLTPVVLAAKEDNGADQRHADLHRAGAGRPLPRPPRRTGRLDHRRDVGRCRHGLVRPVPSDIHTLRGHKGQIDTAAALRALLDNSVIRQATSRATSASGPLLHPLPAAGLGGACLDLLRSVARTLEIEANAVTDNPLVLSDNSVVSGGNFHAEPVAFAADQIAIAVCEIGAIAQRRIPRCSSIRPLSPTTCPPSSPSPASTPA